MYRQRNSRSRLLQNLGLRRRYWLRNPNSELSKSLKTFFHESNHHASRQTNQIRICEPPVRGHARQRIAVGRARAGKTEKHRGYKETVERPRGRSVRAVSATPLDYQEIQPRVAALDPATDRTVPSTETGLDEFAPGRTEANDRVAARRDPGGRNYP